MTQRTDVEEENPFGYQIDVMRVLKQAIKYWYIFVASVLITLSAATIYNRYATQIYKSGTVLLLKDSERRPSELYELTEGFGLSQEMSNLENQKYIYSSPKMVERVIDMLDFEITYNNIGTFKTTELYSNNQPITVSYDSAHSQPIGASFEATVLPDNRIALRVHGEQIWGYNYLTKQYTDYYAEEVDTTFVLAVGEHVSNKMFAFSIHRTGYSTGGHNSNNEEERTEFHFNTIQSLVALWRSRLSIEVNTEGGSVAFVNVTGTNINKTLRFLEGLNNATSSYSLDKKNETALRTLSFLKKQLALTSDSLNRAAERIRMFKEQHNFAGGKPFADDLHKTYFEKEKELQELMTETEFIKIISAKLQSGETLEDYFMTIAATTNPVLQRNIQELIVAQQTLNTLKNQSDSNPFKRQQVENEQLLRNNLRTLLSQALEQNAMRINAMKAQIAQMAGKADQLPQIESEYLNLERNYKIQDAIYTFLLQKESENQIAKASNTSDNEVLQEPTYLGTVAPDTHRNTTTAMAIGLLLPAAVLVLLEYFNNKVRSIKELKAATADTPILSTIPLGDTNDDMPSLTSPKAQVSEAFRTLRARLNFVAPEQNSKLIMFTSCNPGEGKTFCAINTAINIALSGKTCAIVNYDLRRPRIEKAFGLDNNTGITDYLIGHADVDDITLKTRVDGLYIVPSGPIPPNPSELISSEKNQQLLRILRSKFDIIIIDTAPIGCVADAHLLENDVDAVLFVVKNNSTEMEHLNETVLRLRNNNVKSLCMIFNGMTTAHREYKYYGRSYYN